MLQRQEFSGNTEDSLKRVFNKMVEKAARHLHVATSDVTLAQVAEDAKSVESSRKVTEKTKVRQMEIIEYFEQVIKTKGIKNYL